MRTSQEWPAVVIGLALLGACGGSRKPSARADGTTATTSIGSAELERAQTGRMEDLLARVPGLEVIRKGGEIALRVRGNFSGGDPLVVVDGMVIRTGGVSQLLNGMNPHDVARIEVLKDAGSTAIYGSGGVNGVVLITTRRGRKP